MTKSTAVSNKTFTTLALTAALAFASTSAWATNHEPDHSAHHPGVPSATPAPDSGATVPPQVMQKQMQAMKAMHEKMMNAKTPEERSALMAEHMQTMRDGMGMMQKMGQSGGMGGMGAPKGGKAMACDMHESHRMMGMRMEMMESMMQMMMDHMQMLTPAPSAGKQ